MAHLAEGFEAIEQLDNSEKKDNLLYYCKQYDRLNDEMVFDYKKHISIDELKEYCLRKLIYHSSEKLNSIYSNKERITDNQTGNYPK
jgi:hypothetical protein